MKKKQRSPIHAYKCLLAFENKRHCIYTILSESINFLTGGTNQ